MAVRNMNIGRVTWDDVTDMLTIQFVEPVDPDASGPPVTGPFNWSPRAGSTVTVSMKVTKGVIVSNLWGVLAQPTNQPGIMLFTRWERIDGVWTNRGPCNPDGSQPVVAG